MEPLKMKCEHDGCTQNAGRDYQRNSNEQFAGWEDEPIFLCDAHAEGHAPHPPARAKFNHCKEVNK